MLNIPRRNTLHALPFVILIGFTVEFITEPLSAQRPLVAGPNAGVSTGHPLTSAAALETLLQGGNAFDADWISGVKFASILSGGIILRFVIVWGGELKAPLTVLPQLNQIPLGG